MSETPDLDRQFEKIRFALYYADPIKAILHSFDRTPAAERDAFVMALAFEYLTAATRLRLIDDRKSAA